MNGRWAIMKSSVILEERLITASHASIVGRTQTQVLLLARWNTHEGFISCAQCWTTLHECPLWGKRWFPSQHTPNRIPGQVVSGDQLWKPESGKYVSPLLHTRNLRQGRGDIKGQGKYKSVCSPDKHCLKTRLFWCVFSDPERHGNVLSLSTKMTLNGTLPMLLQGSFWRLPNMGRDVLTPCGKGSRHTWGKVDLLTGNGGEAWIKPIYCSPLVVFTDRKLDKVNLYSSVHAWSSPKFIWRLAILIKHRLDNVWLA